MSHSWLKEASIALAKPKESVIEVLRKNLAGYQEDRDRSQVHASDITKSDFCPREWAIKDIKNVKPGQKYIPTALAATFDLGNATAKVLIEKWSGDSVVGNWQCQRCGDQRTMTTKPSGACPISKGKTEHLWSYVEVSFEAPAYNVSGSLDAIFQLGTPHLRVVELKIMAPTEFETLTAPLSEHRIRTSLYMRLIEESNSVWKSKFNLLEGIVLYVSRAYGKMNDKFGEILPFKEFIVKRDDSSTETPLKKAKALKIFREQSIMPNGVCETALDKRAQKCSVCKECFSGEYEAQKNWQDL